jgi:stage II sporulation protein M
MANSNNVSSFVEWFFGKQPQLVNRILIIFKVIVFLYFVTIFMGFSLGNTLSYDSISGIVGNIPDLITSNFFTTFTNLFLHNLQASFISIMTGFLMGIPPFLFVAFNGFVLGLIIQSATSTLGLVTTLSLILPHGVFEMTATLLSSAIGAYLGYTMIERLRGRDSIIISINYASKLFLKRIVPLLVIAALIETALIFFMA